MSTAQIEVQPAAVAYDDWAASRCRGVLAAIFGDPGQRPFDVRFWDGTVDRGANPNPPYTLVLNRPAALRRMLLPPNELSIVESFISGDVDIDGSVEAASNLGEAIGERLRSPIAVAKLVRLVMGLPGQAEDDLADARFPAHARKLGPRHTPVRDAAAIQFHYDVGNSFYKLWLDPAMVYSCAYFRSPDDTLDVAQVAKLDLICRKLRLKPGERLLDIGCGWGALIMHAAKHYGVDATGITLSENQAVLARERIEEAGLGDRCRVAIRDYRTLTATDAYDKISSVGMVEHVGLSHLPVYFESAYRALKPGGLFMNHGIISLGEARPRSVGERVFRKFWRADAFIDKYVFPDGKLTATHSVISAAEGAGFEVRDVESLREHYAMTLRHWVGSLEEKRDEAIALVGDRTYRVWRLYMAASANAFAKANINIIQTLLAKPDEHGHSNIPLTRDDLYAKV
ncbi:MAG TPA: cyclopropane-fatty-acyl-phospholipid synthase family protein [Gemmatimonadaceae bacterium]|jgi:cyclopropane-fatty-acyl-phospholipid synthase|nr:cyclopropane-fatty-acyl-phospholipid synthase family protein [Gemmatimonadaceae bacterium]